MNTKSLIGISCFNKARRTVRMFMHCAAIVMASLSILILSTCDQASLFYNISQETAPKDSIIEGQLSKIVKQGSNLYVANGDLWKFDGSGWTDIIPMNDKGPYIYDVAASSNGNVYYLTREHSNAEGDTAKIYKRDSSGAATQIGEGSFVSDTNLSYCQNIFCANDDTNDVLFAQGPLNGSEANSGPQKYSGAGDTWSPVGISGLLEGVVYANGDYYYATTGNGTGGGGLWKGTSRLKDTSDNDITADITGIISIDDISSSNSVTHLAAVSSGNTIYQIVIDTSNNTESVSSVSTGSRFTGALAVWTDPDNNQQRLLLVGYYNYGEDYDNGYREIVITDNTIGTNTNGALNLYSFLSMPGDTSTIPYTPVSGGKDKFRTNMGRYIINSIIQYFPEEQTYPADARQPQTAHPMFASTENNGLYSYRWRDNNGWVEEWNGEE